MMNPGGATIFEHPTKIIAEIKELTDSRLTHFDGIRFADMSLAQLFKLRDLVRSMRPPAESNRKESVSVG